MLAEEERGSATSSPIYVLDGALGTVLEELPSNPASTSLWSAGLLSSSPERLKEVNEGYIRAGADIIETATYQCSFEGFKDNGFPEAEAERLMRLAVEIAHEAIQDGRRRPPAENSERNRGVKLALSLGPYGATLKPGREYSGLYPPPFNMNPEEPEAAQDHLKSWHKRRLDVFLRDPEVWGKVDLVAFETIPRLDEVVVLREIMEELDSDGRGKPWWISCVFPDGKFPDGHTISNIFKTFIGNRPTSGQRGIGINCTKLKFLPELLIAFAEANKQFIPSDCATPSRPFLVLYPDGGQTYDPITRTWSEKEDDIDGEGVDTAWAIALTRAAQNVQLTGLWEKVIIGGCCKAAYGKIEALRRLVDANR